MQLTDDQKMAIVQFVATDTTAFAPLFRDRRPGIRVFQIGKDSRQTIESEMRKVRKDFNLDSFLLSVH